MNVMRLLPLLSVLVLLGLDVPKGGAQGQPANDPDSKLLDGSRPTRKDERGFKYRVTNVVIPPDGTWSNFLDGSQPTREDLVGFRYRLKGAVGLPLLGTWSVFRDAAMSKMPGLVIERITVEGGKVEISGDTIKIEGGKVEIIRQPRP